MNRLIKHCRIRHWIPLAVLLSAAAAHGEKASSTVELEGIEHIHLLGPHSLVVRQGDREQVTVTTEKEYLDEARAQIKGRSLALGREQTSFWSWSNSTPDWRAHFEVTLRRPKSISNLGSGEITVKPLEMDDDFTLENKGSGDVQVESLSVRKLEIRGMGSGDLEVDRGSARQVSVNSFGSGDTVAGELQAEAVDLTLFGSGDLEIEGGSAEDLRITIHGSGNVDTANFHSQRVEVTIGGSGEVEVYAGEALNVRINGSGEVYYHGEPAIVDKSINGSGEVEPRN